MAGNNWVLNPKKKNEEDKIFGTIPDVTDNKVGDKVGGFDYIGGLKVPSEAILDKSKNNDKNPGSELNPKNVTGDMLVGTSKKAKDYSNIDLSQYLQGKNQSTGSKKASDYSDIDLSQYLDGTSQSTGTKKASDYSDVDLSQYDNGYTKSDNVLESEKRRNDAEKAAAGYGDFEYSKNGSLDDIINKILNREDFSYDLNGDVLYQQYKDKYIRQGKAAMEDTIGKAAAMNGGYGSSYGEMVGGQAYQQSLDSLNDVIPELYQLAYDKYAQKGQDLYNRYSMLQADKNAEYGVWGDKYNRLVSDRDYYSSAADKEYSKDYGEWTDKRNYDTTRFWNDAQFGQSQDRYATEDARNERDYKSNQFWNEAQFGQAQDRYAAEDARDERDYKSNQFWNEAQFGQSQDRYGVSDEQWQKSFDEGKRQYDEQMALQKKNTSSSAGLSNLSPTQYDSIMTSVNNYVVDGDSDGLENYLNGLVNRGWITEDEASDIWDKYNNKSKSDTKDK